MDALTTLSKNEAEEEQGQNMRKLLEGALNAMYSLVSGFETTETEWYKESKVRSKIAR
jgi:hypothetical protein